MALSESYEALLLGVQEALSELGGEVDVLRSDNLSATTRRLVERLPRLRGQRWARIDYHHVIWSLVKKPGAFARYRWREELFPTLMFRRILRER
ncbi:MAG: hypothetical protein C5B58_12045 [Acidobacteria bacterium]|nr:MAG: hypothetical protein C5B58_12045 [Acidobacteriota bacterium]